MPWATFKEGDEFCVYKLNADNEKTGESLGCHPSRDKAQAQVAALYAKEPKSLKEAKCNDEMGYGMPVMPYSGATSIKDALAAMEAQEAAAAIQSSLSLFQSIVSNISASPVITDKASAIASAARELQGLMKDPSPFLKAQKDTSPLAWLKGLFSRPEEKAGARHRKEDQDALDNAHEALVRAGANCPGMMKVMKGKDGQYYAYGIVSNKFRDRDYAKHPKGEIITESAHKEFVQFLDEHPEQAPELWSWHTPGTARKSRATWWEYSDGFLQMLWPLTEKEAKAFDDGEEIAMSHGFYTLKRNADKGLIEQYRSFEGSDLPASVAANPYTALEVMQKELSDMFTPEKRAYLVKRLGEDRVKELEGNTEAMGKALETAGVEYKATEENANVSVTQATTTKSDGADTVPVQPIVVDEKSVGALVESIKAALNVDGLQQVIAELQTQMKEQGAMIEALQKSDDEKVAQTIAPKVKPVTWGFQASQAKETRLTEAETAQHAKSKPGWAAEVFSGANGQAH